LPAHIREASHRHDRRRLASLECCRYGACRRSVDRSQARMVLAPNFGGLQAFFRRSMKSEICRKIWRGFSFATVPRPRASKLEQKRGVIDQRCTEYGAAWVIELSGAKAKVRFRRAGRQNCSQVLQTARRSHFSANLLMTHWNDATTNLRINPPTQVVICATNVH
jgi:hypothetical protein